MLSKTLSNISGAEELQGAVAQQEEVVNGHGSKEDSKTRPGATILCQPRALVLPAVLLALSDMPPDSRSILGPLGVILPSSRMPHNEIGRCCPRFAAKSSGLGASRACNLLLLAS